MGPFHSFSSTLRTYSITVPLKQDLVGGFNNLEKYKFVNGFRMTSHINYGTSKPCLKPPTRDTASQSYPSQSWFLLSFDRPFFSQIPWEKRLTLPGESRGWRPSSHGSPWVSEADMDMHGFSWAPGLVNIQKTMENHG